LEQDLVKIQQPAYKGKALMLPSWHMAMCVLRHFPQEFGYQTASKSSNISSYSEDRSVACYFSTCWQAHLDFSVGLWKASRQFSPDFYQVCKDFCRQLPVCLVYQSVARAIFQSETPNDEREPFSSPQSPRLKPLIGMLNLYNMADDLEGLTNQVAALLVIHARNIKNNNICSSAELERSTTCCMDRSQKVQWRELSLVVAKAMVDKKRQLSNDEFGRIIQKIYRR
jgi:hypothetical protein